MSRCKAITISGNRCKRKSPDTLCCIHKEVICGLCNKNTKNNVVLNQCNHVFCKDCLANDIYDFQWFDDFSTEHPLICPECDHELCDTNWQTITDYLVKIKKLQRKIVYTCYVNKEWSNIISNFIEFGKEYTPQERDRIESKWLSKNCIPLYHLLHPDDIPSKVYFEKYKIPNNQSLIINYSKNLYSFEIDYPLLKKQNESFHKELVEYMYHPKRVEKLGIDYLDY
jgi:hypothetical protein